MNTGVSSFLFGYFFWPRCERLCVEPMPIMGASIISSNMKPNRSLDDGGRDADSSYAAGVRNSCRDRAFRHGDRRSAGHSMRRE